MKIIRKILIILALVLSHSMCCVVTYNYRGLLCAIDHAGFSAPANLALLTAIPYLLGIALCILGVIILRKKEMHA